MAQHSDLTPERWSQFSLDQQVLMIANEMQRATNNLAPERLDSLRLNYERVLRLIDLTVRCNPRRALRRELLRWRDLIAELYIAQAPNSKAHSVAFRCLLLFTPVAAQQLPYVTLFD